MAFAFISEQNRLAQPNLNYVWDSGTMSWVKMTQPTGGAGGAVDQGAAGADPWLVHVENAAGADAVNIQDGGNSITVDGAVTVSATDLDIRNLVFATDKVDVSGSSIAVDTTGLATDTNQTDGSQKTQIVDGSGNVIGATSNALDVNIKSSTSLAVTGPLTDTQLRATPVPVSGTVTASAQPGVDIGDVTVNNAAGAAAVNIQDGGNSITVDGTVAVTNAGLTNLDVALSTRTKPADQQHTIIDSGTVTAVTAITNALPAGSNVIGHVIADSGSTTAVTGNVTVVQGTGTNLHAVIDSGTINTKTDLTPSAPTAASVGVASAQAVAAAATRKGLILINTSVNRISLGFGAAAVLDSGVTLYPGGSYSMGEYDFDLGAVNAIASAAASNLAVQEYTT